MKNMYNTSSNSDSIRVLRAKLLLSNSYAASLVIENETLVQQMQDIELQEITNVRFELVDLANRLDAWSRVQEESHRNEEQLLEKLQKTDEELQLAREKIEESDRKYKELLTYAKENLNQLEKEKAVLRRKLAEERRKNAADKRAIVTQIILESEDSSALEIEDDDATEVGSIAAFVPSSSYDQSTQTDDLVVESNAVTESSSQFTGNNKSGSSQRSLSRERKGSVTSEEAERRPWQKESGSTQSINRHMQNQLSRQACELDALRKDRILLQSQLDHCRWLLWDLEEYRNWNRRKSALYRQREPFQLLDNAEGAEDLLWQKKNKHFDMLTRLLMKEVNQKNAVISEMSRVCTPMEALSCVHREQERSLKMAAVTSVALAESQMKVDELTAALQRIDASQRRSGGTKNSRKLTGSTTIDPTGTKNSNDSVFGVARMGTCNKSKSEPFLLGDQTDVPLVDIPYRGPSNNSGGNVSDTACNGYQPTLLRGPSRNKIIADDCNTSNFNSKIQSLFRSNAIEWVEKPTDSTTKDFETTIRTLRGRIAILEQENNAFYLSTRMQLP